MTGLVLFAVALMFLFFGYSVAFTFAGISLIVGVLSLGTDLFAFMPYRIMSIMENTTLMAIPMFIFMGIVLQKTGLAEKLLESSAKLFGQVAGGLAISTIIVGALLAASTGVVGASVVAMGVISLPVMLKNNYHQPTATGVICASGTLGQIIPPSIILIILGDVMGVPVGDLFKAAVLPGFLLILMYTLYILALGKIKPEFCPPMVVTESKRELLIQALKDIVPPMLLIITVLGSIFGGIATPTESSAIGAVGAVILATCYGKFSFKMINDVSKESVKVSSMIFAVLLGATAFSMVFTYSGSDFIVEDFFMDLPGGQWTFILSAMVAILILGFFIDFIEIAFLVVPILTPIAMALNIDLVWFAILITMNLQTSFLTPPFGFSLFYLKGVAPKSIKKINIKN
jgi:tripartite ATP-independent transporter DctM subunit